MDYKKRNPNNKTKVINARVSSDVLEALALAEGMIPKDINNSNEFSISKIIKKALNDQLAKIEELHSIDLIRLVEWEKRINSLFDENVKKLKAGDITGNEAGKALGRIFKYDIRIQQRNITNKAINLLINEGTIKNSIDDNIKRGALFIPYSINKKPLKITREIKNTVKSIDLANKSSNEACNELTRFIFNHADKEPYIKVIGLGQGNDRFFTDSIAIYLKKHSQVKAYKYDGIVNALYVNLESFTDENFDRVFESIKQEIYRDISKYESFEDLLIAKEKQFIETWDKAFSSQKSKSNVDTFEDISLDIGDWSNYLAINEINKNVEEELEQFRSQQSITNAQGSTQTLERMKILEAVNTEVNHRGSSCTELVMGDGTKQYMKTITFDRDLRVTAKAKSLVGRKVKTSCWNPISEPGKWSRQNYFRNVYELSDFDYLKEVLKSKRNATIYPSRENWFKAFEYSSFANTKVIILGQEPYHGEDQAEGLSFSVPKGMDIPPSLRNIYEELESDYVEFTTPSHGNLVSWAKQGVLLLNSVLTVEKHSPASHANIGWEFITDQVIRLLSENKDNLVFILWGLYANKKIELIDTKKHKILSASHPSPFSATKITKDLTKFLGCKHFSQTNDYLKKNNLQTINWNIPEWK